MSAARRRWHDQEARLIAERGGGWCARPDRFVAGIERLSRTAFVALTAAIIAINGWNRLAVAFRTVPGTFQSGTLAAGDQEVYAPGSPRATEAGR